MKSLLVSVSCRFVASASFLINRTRPVMKTVTTVMDRKMSNPDTSLSSPQDALNAGRAVMEI
jgi:hypothetical protein